MNDRDELFEIQKNDNIKRITLSAICVMLILAIAFCVYLLFIANKTDIDESSNEAESSFLPAIVTSTHPDESDYEPSEGESSDYTDISDIVSVPSDNSDSSDIGDTSDTSNPITELDFQKYGYIYRYLNHAIEDFTPGTASKNGYMDAIKNLYNEIGTSSDFYHMIIPTQVEFLRSEILKIPHEDFSSQSQSKYITDVINGTPEGIKHIDVTETFKEKYEDGEYLYFNSDINYTALGAYYAYTEFCKKSELTPILLTDFSSFSIDNFLGILYSQTGSSTLLENPDKVTVYDVTSRYTASVTAYNGTTVYNNQKLFYRDVTYGYNAFLGRDAYRYEIDVKNTASIESVLVIGDLAAAPFVPYLTAHYKSITFINATKFDENKYKTLPEFLNGKSYDDVIVIDYATSYKSPYTFATKINKMLGK